MKNASRLFLIAGLALACNGQTDSQSNVSQPVKSGDLVVEPLEAELGDFLPNGVASVTFELTNPGDTALTFRDLEGSPEWLTHAEWPREIGPGESAELRFTDAPVNPTPRRHRKGFTLLPEDDSRPPTTVGLYYDVKLPYDMDPNIVAFDNILVTFQEEVLGEPTALLRLDSPARRQLPPLTVEPVGSIEEWLSWEIQSRDGGYSVLFSMNKDEAFSRARTLSEAASPDPSELRQWMVSGRISLVWESEDPVFAPFGVDVFAPFVRQ